MVLLILLEKKWKVISFFIYECNYYLAYRLYTVLPRLVKFIEQLTNWYVRLNRKRLKGIEGEHDCRTSLATLFEVLYTICRAMVYKLLFQIIYIFL